MAGISRVNLSEMFDGNFPSTEERLRAAYADPMVHEFAVGIIDAPIEDRPFIKAQLITYLAAAHILLPEESQIITNSFKDRKPNV